MLNIKNYKFKFNVYGLLLFLLIMLPNIIWFFIEAPNDILRGDSKTPLIDTFATVMQVILAFCIILFSTTYKKKIYFIFSFISLLIYYAFWICYYLNNTKNIVMLSLCLFPCFTFIFYSLAKKNIFVLISSSIFTILHFIFCLVNFIL